MKIVIELTKAEVIDRVAYEMNGETLPESLTIKEIQAIVMRHFEAVSAHCLQSFQHDRPMEWAEIVCRKAGLRTARHERTPKSFRPGKGGK